MTVIFPNQIQHTQEVSELQLLPVGEIYDPGLIHATGDTIPRERNVLALFVGVKEWRKE